MKKEKKTQHSFVNNTIYMFKILIGWDKAQVPINLLIAVTDVIFELNVVSFVTALTYCLEHHMGIKSILLVTSGLRLFN